MKNQDHSAPVMIARRTIESFVNNGRLPDPADLPAFTMPDLADGRAACFVSLHKNGELRGCIGTVAPTMATVAAEIERNAVSACSEDPRFDPVRPDELDALEISVDILGTPETVSDAALLDPARFGVIVTSGHRRGLLLPDLEGVETVTRQLAIACRKGGISPDERFTMQRFTVTRYH